MMENKSTSGYIVCIGHALVSWCSKRQPVVALSSCEVEYIAACYAACQAKWLGSLLKEIQVRSELPIELKIDKKSTINLAKNPVAHDRGKHIKTCFHFLRDQVNKGKSVGKGR